MDLTSMVTTFGKIERHDLSSSSMDLLWKIAERCASAMKLPDLIIYTYNEEDDVLEQQAGFGFKKNDENELINPLKVRKGDGIVGDTARKMTYQLVRDTHSDNRYIQDGQRNASELSVPIIWNNKLYGILDSEHPNKHHFGDVHIDVFYMIASFLGPRLSLFHKTKKSFSTDNQYYRQFIELMEIDALYRNENLSLDDVASRFDIHKSYLSKIINEASNKKFTDIVNSYRIQDVKQALHDDKHRIFTIMSLAYEAGFSSKTTFNTVFKKETGLTPSQYIHKMVRNR